ncbi:MAG: hypothetical protein JNJ54_01865 [Myxococcaceae bacterium]|nr:hypothetical protein [Myxococcaceae bacterium]
MNETTPTPYAPDVKKELRALADEVRVKLHLAGMDLKDEFTKLEPQLDRAFSSAAIVSVEVLGDLKKRLVELRQRLTN